MPVTWELEADDLLVVRINGELAESEIAECQSAVGPLIQASGRMKFLVIAKDFQGWASGGNWGDTGFIDDNDEQLARFAIVGDEQWREKMLMFSLAGLRAVEIEFFETSEEAAAREWLAAA